MEKETSSNSPLKGEINELYKYIEAGRLERHEVSTKDTFWHIDHSLRVIVGVINLLNDGDVSH